MHNRIIVGVVVASILLAAAGGVIALFLARNQSSSITGYQDCVDRGYPVTEGNPKKCIGPNGSIFTGPKFNEHNGSATTDSQKGMTSPPVQNADRQTIALLVHLSKNPESLSDFTYTQAIARSSNRPDIGTYAIEQLIAGPTEVEASKGLFSPLKGKLQGDSNCGGKDFALSVADRIARLQFCRSIASAGIGDDARITATVSTTLSQFSSVDSVLILTREGNCFGDQSGQNKCL